MHRLRKRIVWGRKRIIELLQLRRGYLPSSPRVCELQRLRRWFVFDDNRCNNVDGL